MTPHAASIERARGNLRAYLNSAGRVDYRHIEFLVGIIVGLRVCAGEIAMKLKKPRMV